MLNAASQTDPLGGTYPHIVCRCLTYGGFDTGRRSFNGMSCCIEKLTLLISKFRI